MGKKKAKDVFSGEDVTKDEEPLQAILLADSFEETFRPVTLETPKALLPLANVPLIEYSLEFLADAGVKEIFVICGWMGEKVQAYLNNSRWKDSTDPLVHVMRFSANTNACHAIRELDGMDRIRSDPFILVSGDVVSNIRLKPILEAHKARRKSKDGGKNNILTMVFSSVDQVKNRIRPLTEDLAVVLDKENKQILKYENNLNSKSIGFSSAEIFDEHPSLEYRYDLLDCNIDICSPQMVAQIADNYDYKDLRQDYIRNEVQNQEYGYRIHAHILTSPSDYACRVRCLRTYDAISKDVIRRWLYPLVPDANWVSEDTSYAFERGFRYRDENVKIARSSLVGENSILGAGTRIAEGAVVVDSVLGPGCVIEKGAVVRGSYLFSNVHVMAGAKVSYSLLCDNVVVDENATVNRGCLLSFNVKIGAGFETTPFSRLTTSTKHEEDNDDDSSFGDFTDEEDMASVGNVSVASGTSNTAASRRKTSSLMDTLPVDEAAVGKGGVGIRWVKHTSTLGRLLDVPKWAESEFNKLLEDLNSPELAFIEVSGGIGCTELEKVREKLWSDLGELVIDDDDEDEDMLAIGAADEQQSEDTRLLQFVAELICAQNDPGAVIEHDNVLLELNGQKFAQNRTFEEIIFAAIPCMIGEVVETSLSRDQAMARVNQKLDMWLPTLEKLCPELTQEVALIRAVEILTLYGQREAGFVGLQIHANVFDPSTVTISESTSAAREAFPMILSHLCVEELVSLDSILKWREGHGATKLPDVLPKSPLLNLVIQQLQEPESSEEEESAEGEGDSDEDEDDEE